MVLNGGNSGTAWYHTLCVSAGSDCRLQQMQCIREQQESLARIHQDTGVRQVGGGLGGGLGGGRLGRVWWGGVVKGRVR